jgi:hypothetical protein
VVQLELAVSYVEGLAGGIGCGRCPSTARPRTPGLTFRRCALTALLVGYDRCSADAQDLTAQRDGLTRLSVTAERIYVDQGLTGTNRERPGLREALAACRAGETLVVTKSTGSPALCRTRERLPTSSLRDRST